MFYFHSTAAKDWLSDLPRRVIVVITLAHLLNFYDELQQIILFQL